MKMTKKTEPITRSEKFRSKGATILKGRQSGLNSMEDFLSDTQIHTYTSPQKRDPTDAVNHKASDNQTHRSIVDQRIKLERLHVQIKQDLVDKLLCMLFERKRDPKIKNQFATKRAIIEEALEDYFKKHGT